MSYPSSAVQYGRAIIRTTVAPAFRGGIIRLPLLPGWYTAVTRIAYAPEVELDPASGLPVPPLAHDILIAWMDVGQDETAVQAIDRGAELARLKSDSNDPFFTMSSDGYFGIQPPMMSGVTPFALVIWTAFLGPQAAQFRVDWRFHPLDRTLPAAENPGCVVSVAPASAPPSSAPPGGG